MFRRAIEKIRDDGLYVLPGQEYLAVKSPAVKTTKLKHTAVKSPPPVKGAAKHSKKLQTPAVKTDQVLKSPDEKKDPTEELFEMLFGKDQGQGDQGDQGQERGAGDPDQGDQGDQGAESGQGDVSGSEDSDKWMSILD